MPGEWEATDLHGDAFDATCAWGWYTAALEATTGGKGPGPLRGCYSTHYNTWPREAMRMTFVSNHDKNSWDGTEFEQFGPGLEAAIVLSVVGEGMPMIYSGQEAGNSRRLPFFEREPIAWQEHPNGDLYRRLIELKKANTALWKAPWGARMVDVRNSAPEQVLSFEETLFEARYTEYPSGREATLEAGATLSLPA